MAQVHRFHDVAGIHAGGGKTSYLTANDARKMAAALLAVARSIEREPFTKAPALTVQIDETPHSFGLPRLERREDGTAKPAARKRVTR